MKYNPYAPPKATQPPVKYTNTAYPTKKTLWLLNIASFMVLFLFFVALEVESFIQNIFDKSFTFVFASLFVMLIPNCATCLWIRYQQYGRDLTNILVIFAICFAFSSLNFLLFNLFFDNDKFMMMDGIKSKIMIIVAPAFAYGFMFAFVSLFCLPKITHRTDE